MWTRGARTVVYDPKCRGRSAHNPQPCLRERPSSVSDDPVARAHRDVEALRKIADLPSVIRADAPHAPEHALEVEHRRVLTTCAALHSQGWPPAVRSTESPRADTQACNQII